jgi:hypothetical protein
MSHRYGLPLASGTWIVTIPIKFFFSRYRPADPRGFAPAGMAAFHPQATLGWSSVQNSKFPANRANDPPISRPD